MSNPVQPPRPAWVERVLGRPGQFISLAWGFAEGTFFFLVPDIAITLAAVLQPRRALRHLAMAVAGAVVAGAVLYGWAERSPAQARAVVARVPYVSAAMFEKVEQDYARLGGQALFLGPRYGIPYKVYAVAAPRHVGAGTFLLLTVPARLERLLLSWLFFSGAAVLLRKLWRDSPAVLACAHLACWMAFYAYYWTVI